MKTKSLWNKVGQLLILFVIFSLILPNYSFAKRQKPGHQIIVTKIDGSITEGELLIVKKDSILMRAHSAGEGQKIDLNNISKVRIKKKSKVLMSMGIGLGFGASIGGLLGYADGSDPYNQGFFSASASAALGGIGLGILGVIAGGITGALVGTDKKINFENKSSEIIKLFVKKLTKYARFKN